MPSPPQPSLPPHTHISDQTLTSITLSQTAFLGCSKSRRKIHPLLPRGKMLHGVGRERNMHPGHRQFKIKVRLCLQLLLPVLCTQRRLHTDMSTIPQGTEVGFPRDPLAGFFHSPIQGDVSCFSQRERVTGPRPRAQNNCWMLGQKASQLACGPRSRGAEPQPQPS